MSFEIKNNFLTIHSVKPTGWLNELLERDVKGIGGYFDKLSSEIMTNGFFCRGTKKGEIEGNWYDGLTRLASIKEDDDIILTKMKEEIGKLLSTQDKDGYIGVYTEEKRFTTGNMNSELWSQSRVFLALLAYYDYTGDIEVLEKLKKAALLTTTKYGPKTDQKTYFDTNDTDVGMPGHGLMMVEPMIMLYDITKNKDYLDFASFCYEDYSSAKSMALRSSDCQMDKLNDYKRPFIGHGVHTVEHLRIPLLLYYYTGLDKYKIAFYNGMHKLKKMSSLSGVIKSNEMAGTNIFDDKTCMFPYEERVSAPLPSVGYEYCAITELLLTYHTAVKLTGEYEYSDLAEKVYFNAAQASRHYDGKGLCYLGSDNQYASKKDMGPRWDYSPTHDDVAHCCPPNLIRITPYHINRMWMLSTDKDKGLVSAFYGPCKLKVTLNDTEVTINQITKYPFEDEILFKIYVSSEIEFPITLRAPEWSEGTTVFINNKYYKTVQKGFFTIKRKWTGENEIRIRFSPVIQLVNAVDGSIAVFRGPLLYSLKIPEKQIITREYNLEGFYDRDYVPEDDAFWDYTLRVRHMGIQGTDFKFELDNNYSGEYPWEKSPIKIIARAYDWNGETKDIELVPIGCTILRRTSFPYYKKYD